LTLQRRLCSPRASLQCWTWADNRIGPERRKRNHIRQLESLGYTVTLTEVA